MAKKKAHEELKEIQGAKNGKLTEGQEIVMSDVETKKRRFGVKAPKLITAEILNHTAEPIELNGEIFAPIGTVVTVKDETQVSGIAGCKLVNIRRILVDADGVEVTSNISKIGAPQTILVVSNEIASLVNRSDVFGYNAEVKGLVRVCYNKKAKPSKAKPANKNSIAILEFISKTGAVTTEEIATGAKVAVAIVRGTIGALVASKKISKCGTTDTKENLYEIV